MRASSLVVGAIAMTTLACSSPSTSVGQAPAVSAPHEAVSIIEATPEPVVPLTGGPRMHAPGASWTGGSALSVAASGHQSCEIRPDHRVACWGDGQAVPAGEFSALSLGGLHTCALGLDGALVCVGAGAT